MTNRPLQIGAHGGPPIDRVLWPAGITAQFGCTDHRLADYYQTIPPQNYVFYDSIEYEKKRFLKLLQIKKVTRRFYRKIVNPTPVVDKNSS